jgi:hypothetical protein
MKIVKKVPLSSAERQANRQANLRQALHLSQVLQRDTRAAVYMIESSLSGLDSLVLLDDVKIVLDMHKNLVRDALKLLIYDNDQVNLHRRSTDKDYFV